MSLKDLTVVVVTYSRQRYVDRQVAYWTELGANLLILDGSPQAHPNRPQWEAFPNVVYVHSTTTYRDRHLMAADLVASKYAILLHDDEFLLNPGISKCVEKLDSDSTIDCVAGRAINFFYQDGNVYGQRIYQGFSNIEPDSDPGLERMEEFWNDQDGYVRHYTLFSMMRRDVFSKLLKQTFATEHTNPYAYEIRLHLVTPLQHRSFLLNELVWLRSGENDPVSIGGFDRSIRFSTWYLDEAHSKEVQQMIDDLAALVSKEGSQDVAKLRNEIAKLLDRYSIADRNRYVGTKKEVSPSILRKKYASLKSSARSLMSSMLPISLRSRVFGRGTTLLAAANEWQTHGVNVDTAEVARVSQIITKFHQQ